jgi:hypothetical protein
MQIAGVSEAVFCALRAQLVATHQAGITGTTAGTITGHGVTANYSFDSAAGTLSVDVIHHPFYIPESAIEAQLRDQIARLKT